MNCLSSFCLVSSDDRNILFVNDHRIWRGQAVIRQIQKHVHLAGIKEGSDEYVIKRII